MIDSLWMKVDIRQTPDDKTLCMPGWMTTGGTPALDDEGFFEMACSCYLTPDQLQRIFNILIETGDITGAHPILRKMPECMTACHSELTCDFCKAIQKQKGEQ